MCLDFALTFFAGDMRQFVYSLAACIVLGDHVADDDILAGFNFEDEFNLSDNLADLSPEKLEESSNRDFDDFDVNQDGQLDPLEIRSKFKGYLEERDMYYFYDQADRDHSGTVDRAEYFAYVKQTHEEEKRLAAEEAQHT